MHRPVFLVNKHAGGGIEEFGRHILLDGRGLTLPHPDEDHRLQCARWVLASDDSARDPRLGAFRQYGEDVAIAVKRPTVIGTRNCAPEMAVAMHKASAPVRTHIPQALDLAVRASEEDQIDSADLEAYRLV